MGAQRRPLYLPLLFGLFIALSGQAQDVTYDLEVDAGLPALAGVMMVYGVSKDTFNGLPLPLDLGVIGAAGCELATTGELTSFLLANPGPNPVSIPVPNNPALQCFAFYQQAAVVDFAANTLGVVLSNASAAVVGN